MNIDKLNLIPLSLASLTILAGTILSSLHVSADDSVVDDVTITVPVSCTLSGTGMDTHNANIGNGIYEDEIGSTTLHAFCNDNNGFAIYAAGYTGDEIGGENSNKLVGTTSGIGNIDTNLNASGNTSGWSMKLTVTGDSGDTTNNSLTIDSAPNVANPSQAEQGATTYPFSDYHVVPNEYTKVAHKNSSTDMTQTTGGATLTTTYAAYISQTQPAGTYTGKVIYVMVHPAMAPAPGSTLIMQDVANWKDTLNPGDEIEAMDARDNKTYTVAKLADGNIWMTQNLDLDLDSTKTYTPADTDVPIDWKPSLSTYETNDTTWNYSTTTPESYDPGEVYWNGTISDWSDWNAYWNSCNWSTTPATCDESLNPYSTYVSSTGDSHYHLGNYYNWSAAVAMNDTSSLTTNGTLVEQSICPAGWTLPRAGLDDTWGNERFSEDTFKALWAEYGFTSSSFTDTNSNNQYDEGENALWTSPLYFAANGDWGGVLGNVGGIVYFWSPVVEGEVYAWYASFSTRGYSYPSSSNNRDTGYSVRCVARPVVSAN